MDIGLFLSIIIAILSTAVIGLLVAVWALTRKIDRLDRHRVTQGHVHGPGKYLLALLNHLDLKINETMGGTVTIKKPKRCVTCGQVDCRVPRLL